MLLFLNLLISAAHAVIPLPEKPYQEPCLTEKIDFRPAMHAAAELKLPIEMLAAAPKLQFPKSRCSSSIVSDKGHILTAGHCLEECFKDQNLFTTAQNGLTVVDTKKLETATCPVKIDGVMRNAKILATNLCPSEVWLRSAETMKVCGLTDYAILELDKPVEAPCYQVSERLAGPGQSVVAIGYPQTSQREKRRAGAQDSDGFGQAMSMGKVLEPQLECQLRIPDPSGQKPFELERQALPDNEKNRAIMQAVKDGALLQSSADILQGSSGGPLAGRYTGKVVGVASFFSADRHSTQKECEGATFFTSAKHLLDHINKNFPNAKEALKCEAKAFAK